MNRLAILASGSGTNAECIINYFKGSLDFEVVVLISNKSDAYALKRAENLSITAEYFPKSEFENGNVLKRLLELKIDFVILAGFLLLLPKEIVGHYRERIINIHPALLPKFGGKGMYGDNVHKAVCDSGEKQSGITIHVVSEEFDKGGHIFQASCKISPDDDYHAVAKKVQELEHRHYPKVIEEYILTHC